MTSKASPASSSTAHPPVGTLIDDDALELVEVLGVGGYGVVYRAVETRSLFPKSFAVKCLAHSQAQTSAQRRQAHIREIALHQIASAHPGVVTLHRVVEDDGHTYIVLDYAPDHDLFTQILNSRRYLGEDALIKHVFLQLLEAVEYCHSLGIYHRDLKPENVLCFDGGYRIAITDFGLATTDKLSEEFRTGSVFHMSPECHGGDYTPTDTYSPKANDVWSLGIILLNLATGRNPWKSATQDDPTFQAYLRDPLGFLPTVLPISLEVNDILSQMLEVDWRQRMTLPELRRAIDDVSTFYSEGVIFEASMARCPWEAGMEIDGAGSDHEQDVSETSPDEDLKSRWSGDSGSDIIFAGQVANKESSYGVPWTTRSSWGDTWAVPLSTSSGTDSDHGGNQMDIYGTPQTPPSISSLMYSSLDGPDLHSGTQAKRPFVTLAIDTNCAQPRYHNSNASMEASSPGSSMMHTAIEYFPYGSSYFIASPVSQSQASIVMPGSFDLGTPENKDMELSSTWDYSATEISYPSRYPSNNNSIVSCHMSFATSKTPSLDSIPWPQFQMASQHSQRCIPGQYSSSSHFPPATIIALPASVVTPPVKPSPDNKFKGSSIFNPIKFFPRSPPSSSSSTSKGTSFTTRGRHSTDLFPSNQAALQPPQVPMWSGLPGAGPDAPLVSQDRNCRRSAHFRSARQWFMPGKFFTSTGAS